MSLICPSVFTLSTIVTIAKRIVRILLTSSVRFSSSHFNHGLNHSEIYIAHQLGDFQILFTAVEYSQTCIKGTPFGEWNALFI